MGTCMEFSAPLVRSARWSPSHRAGTAAWMATLPKENSDYMTRPKVAKIAVKEEKLAGGIAAGATFVARLFRWRSSARRRTDAETALAGCWRCGQQRLPNVGRRLDPSGIVLSVGAKFAPLRPRHWVSGALGSIGRDWGATRPLRIGGHSVKASDPELRDPGRQSSYVVCLGTSTGAGAQRHCWPGKVARCW